MRELALFAGAGGGILGGHLLGWRTVCAVEYEPYAAAVLIQRQNDGILQPFPVWDDVRTFDGKPWRGCVDVVSGGFPCQDISSAGRGDGITGERSGLWKEMARIICEVRPRYVFVENSPLLTSRGIDVVLGDLAAMGFDAEWGVYGAADAGAPHQRDRIWIVAVSQVERWTARGILGGDAEGQPELVHGSQSPRPLADTDGSRRLQPQGTQQEQRRRSGDGGQTLPHADILEHEGSPYEGRGQGEEAGSEVVLSDTLCAGREEQHAPDLAARPGQRPRLSPLERGVSGRATEPGLGRMADGLAYRLDKSWPAEPGGIPRVAKGVPHRVGRIKSIGNGQVPACAVMAWLELSARMSL